MNNENLVRDSAAGWYIANTAVLTDEEILAAAEEILARRLFCDGYVIDGIESVRKYLKIKLALQQAEVFAVVFLNIRHRVLAYEEMFHGTIDGTSVHPREVVRRCLHHNAAAVIIAHNHPSGTSEPSQADQSITLRLKGALALIDVRMLDHFVVGETMYSFAEHGLL